MKACDFDRDFDLVKKALARYAALMARNAATSEEEAGRLRNDGNAFLADWENLDAHWAKHVASELRICLERIKVKR